MLSYVATHSKQRKTTKVIKLQWIASIWCQKHQTNAKLQKWSYFDELHRFDVKTIKTFELGRKTFKTTQNAKLQKQSNKDQFASIWRQNDQKCWVTSQLIQNNAKLRKSSNYKELHRFDVKNIKPTQNYKSDLISMNCIDLMSKRSKHLS